MGVAPATAVLNSHSATLTNAHLHSLLVTQTQFTSQFTLCHPSHSRT